MSPPSTRQQETLSFRTFVLLLKKQNPSWTASNIADFLEQSDNPPNLNRHSLMKKINYWLKRRSIDEKKRSGRPRTTTTTAYRNTILQEIEVKRKASIKSVSARLRQNGWKASPSSVYRTAKLLGLKWFKKKRTQKLTIENKIQRVKCAKILRRIFGATKRSKAWRWDRVVNTDFSGKFTLDSSSNPHNEGVWATSVEEIPSAIYHREKSKFASGIVFWGGISHRGLIPKNGPFDVTSWLKNQTKEKPRQKKYMNGQLYAKFIEEVGHILINFKNLIFRSLR